MVFDTPFQSIPIIRADAFVATSGANEGDCLSFANDLVLDDCYTLEGNAETSTIKLATDKQTETLKIHAASRCGKAGNVVHIDSLLTFMDTQGATVELVVLVEVNAGFAVGVFVVPLAHFQPEHPYRLVGVERSPALQRFAELGCASFARGTRITMGTGEQKPIEELQQGDLVLTRDGGIQPVRWIGKTTTRAIGGFAPVRIKAGALSNHADLRIAPHHKILAYQREDLLNVGHSEILVAARDLIDGDKVVQEEGGYIEYFQILFEQHQIIFAEGLAAETLHLSLQTKAALPRDVIDRVLHGEEMLSNVDPLPRLSDRGRDALASPKAIETLKHALVS